MITSESVAVRTRWREPLLWALAFVAAAATGIGTRSYLRERAQQAQAAVEARFHPTAVVVARTNLPPGSALAPEVLAVRKMPTDYLPASTVPASEAVTILGRTVEHALRAGEPVQMSLLRANVPERLAQRIPLGRRAVTVAVDESSALAGLLHPGDRVDLHWRGRAGAALANVAVLATGREFGPATEGVPSRDFATITLELPEAEARRLAESDTGDLRILLRNPGDTGEPLLPGVTARPRSAARAVALIVGGQGGPSPLIQLLPAVSP